MRLPVLGLPVPGLPVLGLAMALALPASAAVTILPEKAEAGPAMLAYAATPAYRKLLAGALARVPASVVPRCPKLVVEDGAIILQQQLQFGPDKVPVAGGWRHSQPTHGCGADTLVNFFFYPGPGNRILTVVGLPGTTRTDLAQQNNARTFVLLALEPAVKDCRQFETVNTAFGGWGTKAPDLADSGPSAEFRPWWESWTMLGCGKRYTVPVNFLPNRLGTQVRPGTVEKPSL